jgi:hypothetical protein
LYGNVEQAGKFTKKVKVNERRLPVVFLFRITSKTNPSIWGKAALDTGPEGE